MDSAGSVTTAQPQFIHHEQNDDRAPPPKKTRGRKSKKKDQIVNEEKPALRMADGKLSTTEFKKGKGIREPIPAVKASGLFFNTRREAIQGVGRLSWMPPANDATIPETDDQMREWVLRVRDAIMDMGEYLSTTGSKMQNRWLPEGVGKNHRCQDGDVLQNPYYPAHWLERRAWDLVVSSASGMQKLKLTEYCLD